MQLQLRPKTSLDLALPWVLGGPEAPLPRLGRRNLFLLAARECFRDGHLDDHENEVLQRLCRVLKIPSKDARKMAGVARAEVQSGKVARGGALDVEKLFRKAADLAAADGEVDTREAVLLDLCGRVLGLPLSTRKDILEDARREPTGEFENTDELAAQADSDSDMIADQLVAEAGAEGPSIEVGPATPGDAETGASHAVSERAPVVEFEVPSVDGSSVASSFGSPRTGNWNSGKGSDRWKKKQRETERKARRVTRSPGGQAAEGGPPTWLMPVMAGLLVVLLSVCMG